MNQKLSMIILAFAFGAFAGSASLLLLHSSAAWADWRSATSAPAQSDLMVLQHDVAELKKQFATHTHTVKIHQAGLFGTGAEPLEVCQRTPAQCIVLVAHGGPYDRYDTLDVSGPVMPNQ